VRIAGGASTVQGDVKQISRERRGVIVGWLGGVAGLARSKGNPEAKDEGWWNAKGARDAIAARLALWHLWAATRVVRGGRGEMIEVL
jgi:hypothetical protein